MVVFVYVRADVKGSSWCLGTATGAVNFLISEAGSNNGYLSAGLNSQGNTSLINVATTFPVGKNSITAYSTMEIPVSIRAILPQ